MGDGRVSQQEGRGAEDRGSGAVSSPGAGA